MAIHGPESHQLRIRGGVSQGPSGNSCKLHGWAGRVQVTLNQSQNSVPENQRIK